MVLERLIPYIFLVGGFLVGVSIFWYLRLWERGQEEHWDAPAPARRLPRLFLAGFALCLLSGPLVLWLLLRGGAAAPVDTAALLARLPDAATQELRHHELIAAISGLQSTGGATGAPWPALVRLEPSWHPTLAGTLAALGALMIAGAGALVWGRLRPVLGPALALVLMLAGAAALVQATPDLLVFAVRGASGTPWPTGGAPPPTVDPSPAPSSPAEPLVERETAALRHVADVGPFPAAADRSDPAQVARAFEALEGSADLRAVGFVLIVGHTDPRPLAAGARVELGSNLALAQARASWVRQLLLEQAAGALDPERVLALPAGPPPAAAGEPMGDRRVSIHVFGARRPGP